MKKIIIEITDPAIITTPPRPSGTKIDIQGISTAESITILLSLALQLHNGMIQEAQKKATALPQSPLPGLNKV